MRIRATFATAVVVAAAVVGTAGTASADTPAAGVGDSEDTPIAAPETLGIPGDEVIIPGKSKNGMAAVTAANKWLLTTTPYIIKSQPITAETTSYTTSPLSVMDQ